MLFIFKKKFNKQNSRINNLLGSPMLLIAVGLAGRPEPELLARTDFATLFKQ